MSREAPASVDCWRISLEHPDDSLAGLSSDEVERARRFRYVRDRARYAVSHRALRGILAQVTGLSPDALRFTHGPQGKPSLHPAIGWAFNLSHSGDLAVVAVTGHDAVGVDVEAVRPTADLAAVAATHFSPRERGALFALSPEAQGAAFFRLWTRKEAYIKAVGTGLSHPLEAFSVSLEPHEARLLELEGDATRAAGWAMAELPLPPGYAGAVTLEAPGLQLTMHDWPG